MTKSYKFLIFLATLLLVVLAAGRAGPAEKAEVFPPQTIALEPFYLVHEHQARAWIERIIITLEVGRAQSDTAALHLPSQRSRLFDLLVSDPQHESLPAKIQAVLNQTLGERQVNSVKLNRSFLLF